MKTILNENWFKVNYNGEDGFVLVNGEKIVDNDIVLANYKNNNKSIAVITNITPKGLFGNIGYELMVNRCKNIILQYYYLTFL